MTVMEQGHLVAADELQPCNSEQSAGCRASRHGTALAYQVDGCRCPSAKAEQRRYRKQLRWRHQRGDGPIVPAVGTLRRLRALQAMGWPRPEIMRRLGLRDSGTWLIYSAHVNERTAQVVRALYDELADVPGPSKWTRTYARNQGWLGPLWWDDDTIDDPNYDPQTTASNESQVVDYGMPFVGQGFLWHQIKTQPGDNRLQPGFTNDFIDAIAVERYADGEDGITLNQAEKLAAYVLIQRRGASRNEAVRRLKLSGTTAAKYDEMAAGLAVLVKGSPHPVASHDREERTG